MRYLLALALLLIPLTATAQVTARGNPQGTGTSMTISSTTVTPATATGGSATLCARVEDGILLYVTSNGIYFAFNGATPASTTGVAGAGTYLYVKPWNRITLLRSSGTDATVWGQCFE